MGGLNVTNIMVAMIVICAAIAVCMVFLKQLKLLIKLIIRSIIGLTAVYIINLAAAPFGLLIGINLFNALFIGVLGIPGLLTLYTAAKFFG